MAAFDENMTGTLFGNSDFATTGETIATTDFNNDGIDDLVISTNPTGELNRAVDVIFGQDGGFPPTFTIDDLLPGESVRLTNSEPGSYTKDFGGKIVTGDFNGDGRNDIAVWSSKYDFTSDSSDGFVSVFFGRPPVETRDFILDLGTSATWDSATFDGTDGVNIRGGQPGMGLGTALDNLGDINGDGVDDLGIGTGLPGGQENTYHVVFDAFSSGQPNVTIDTLDTLQLRGFGPGNIVTEGVRSPLWRLSDIPGTDEDPLLAGPSAPGQTLALRVATATVGDVLDFGVTPLIENVLYLVTMPGELIVAGGMLDLGAPASGATVTRYTGFPDSEAIPWGLSITDIDGDNIPDIGLSHRRYDGSGANWFISADTADQADSSGDVSVEDPVIDAKISKIPDGPFSGRGTLQVAGDVTGRSSESVNDFFTFVWLDQGGQPGFADTFENLLPPQRGETLDELTRLKLGVGASLPDLDKTSEGVSNGSLSAFSSPGGSNGMSGTIAPYAGAVDYHFNGRYTDSFTLDPAEFDGSNGFRVHGEAPFGGLGWSVAYGDVTGDRIDDMIISAPWADTDGFPARGAVYTVAGGAKNLRAQDFTDHVFP